MLKLMETIFQLVKVIVESFVSFFVKPYILKGLNMFFKQIENLKYSMI